jgi:hypothetical protein
VVKVIRRIIGMRPVTSSVPRHRRDRREMRTHPWFELREQRTLELGQYR